MISSSQMPLPAQQTTNIRAVSGIRTRDSSSQSAGDLCRRPHGRGLRTTFSFHSIFVNLIQHYTVQRFSGGGVELQPHELLTLTVNDKWSVSCSGRFTPGIFFWVNVGWAPDFVCALWWTYPCACLRLSARRPACGLIVYFVYSHT